MLERRPNFHLPGPAHILGKTIDGRSWRAYWHENPKASLDVGYHEAWVVTVDEREIGTVPGDRGTIQGTIKRSVRKLLHELGLVPLVTA